MPIRKVKHSVDGIMLLGMIMLLAFPVTEEAAHEWIGLGETALMLLHQILNRGWYKGLFKGKYSALRIFSTVLNLLLLLSFIGTAFTGMSMSGEAVPSLYGMGGLSSPQMLHLSLSHWTFVLMGMHLGMHLSGTIAARPEQKNASYGRAVLLALLPCAGLYLFIENQMFSYLLFQVHFALVNGNKPATVILAENLLMLLPWIFAGSEAAQLLRKK